MKKSKDDLDKKTKSYQVSAYGDMINNIYQAPKLNALSFSQYRFALCERDKNAIESMKFKKIISLLSQCQNNSADEADLLGTCINRVMNKK